MTLCLGRYTLAGKMKELDKARQRIEDKKQADIDRKKDLPKNLDMIKGPVLDMETEFLKNAADTISPILQDTKTEIGNKEGFVLGQQVSFDFKYDNYSGFVHKVWDDEGGTHGEEWKQLEKHIVESRPYGNSGDYIDTYQWQEKDVLPEKLIDSSLANSNWAKTNVALNRVSFQLYNNEHKCFLYIVLEKTDSSPWWTTTLKGPSGIKYPARGYNDEGAELLAEDLVDFLDNKKYFKKTDTQNRTKVNNEIQESDDASTSNETKQMPIPKEDLDAILLSERAKDLIDQTNQDQLRQDQYYAMQEEERGRVLAQIEEMEKSDPNYQRPSWISPDERSRRSVFGIQLNEREQFQNDDEFNIALQRHFPKPRENG